eukprot:1278246-Rhodomonas_salina.1
MLYPRSPVRPGRCESLYFRAARGKEGLAPAVGSEHQLVLRLEEVPHRPRLARLLVRTATGTPSCAASVPRVSRSSAVCRYEQPLVAFFLVCESQQQSVAVWYAGTQGLPQPFFHQRKNPQQIGMQVRVGGKTARYAGTRRRLGGVRGRRAAGRGGGVPPGGAARQSHLTQRQRTAPLLVPRASRHRVP